MSPYHLVALNRQEYLDSTSKIADEKTLRFSKMSLEWWDRHFSWKADSCIVLADSRGEHLSYIFYKIDRYRQYMTIHNLFTPLVERRKGYALELLTMVFDIAVLKHVGRFKLTSISNSLDFYLALGFVYWGVNRVGDYYCDLPVPPTGLIGLEAMTATADINVLVGKQLSAIFAKVSGNELRLELEQSRVYKQDCAKMNKEYRLAALGLLHQKHHP